MTRFDRSTNLKLVLVRMAFLCEGSGPDSLLWLEPASGLLCLAKVSAINLEADCCDRAPPWNVDEALRALPRERPFGTPLDEEAAAVVSPAGLEFSPLSFG